jgi:nickel-dependent lactate racemase
VDLELPYGRVPYRIRLDGSPVVVTARGADRPARPLGALLDDALASPIGTLPIERLVSRGERVLLVVSDPSRDEPRAAMIAALRARLPDGVHVTLAIATGTHGPCDPRALDLPRDLDVIVHDGHSDLVELGTTRRGTPIRIHRAVLDARVLATGAIRPHYFAGFGAGAKALFPGLGGATEIRINHRLKSEPGARAGVVDGNPCREDLEEVVAMLPVAPFLVNVVAAPDGSFRAAVAGDVLAAFRVGAELARGWFLADAPRSRWIVASDALPVTSSLYQASKIVAAVAPLLEEDGTIVLVAECADGIGPVDVVNRAIYEIGLAPRLPPRHRILLVSSLSADTVAPSYARWSPSVETALVGATDPIVVAPHASALVLS